MILTVKVFFFFTIKILLAPPYLNLLNTYQEFHSPKKRKLKNKNLKTSKITEEIQSRSIQTSTTRMLKNNTH